MKNILTKNVIKVISFLLIFVVLFVSLDSILAFKYSESIIPIKTFYEQEEDTVDVLIIGSSHSYSNFRPHVLWENYGYSSYIMGASVQPIWNSYYYLEEALKTQSPEVIILEGYRLVETKEYTTPYYAIKSTYGMKWSSTKIASMIASFKPEELSSYIFEFSNYHSRYNDVSKNDFSGFTYNKFYELYKGELNKTETHKLSTPDVDSFDKKEKKLGAKTEEYYIKMLELAKSHNIPLVTIVAPYSIPQSEYGYYKYAEKIAESYGMPFINTNELYDEIGIDFKSDFSDEYGHLNSSGAEKFTAYVGKFLNKNYTLKDHRSDEKYESWQTHADNYDRYYNNPIKNETDLVSYIAICEAKGDYSYIFILNNSDCYSDELADNIKSVFTMLNHETSEISDGILVFRDSKLKYKSSSNDLDKSIRFDSDFDVRLMYNKMSFELKTLDGDYYYACLNKNDEKRGMPLGMTMVVYDELYNRVVETVYCSGDSTELTRVNEFLKND